VPYLSALEGVFTAMRYTNPDLPYLTFQRKTPDIVPIILRFSYEAYTLGLK